MNPSYLDLRATEIWQQYRTDLRAMARAYRVEAHGLLEQSWFLRDQGQHADAAAAHNEFLYFIRMARSVVRQFREASRHAA